MMAGVWGFLGPQRPRLPHFHGADQIPKPLLSADLGNGDNGMGGGSCTKKQMSLTVLELAVLRAEHLHDGLNYSLCPQSVLCQNPPVLPAQMTQLQWLVANRATLSPCHRTLADLLPGQDWAPHRGVGLSFLKSPTKQTPNSHRSSVQSVQARGPAKALCTVCN